MTHISRRSFLKGSAAALVLLAGGGTLARAIGQGVFSVGQGPAYELWQNWPPAESDPQLSIIHAATLAASPHNVQPWVFHIRPGQIDLLADFTRSTNSLDALRRELYIGLGCALENLLIAAEAARYPVKAELLPNPSDPAYIARVTLGQPGPAGEPSALYSAIPHRHTNRAAYQADRAVDAAQLDRLSGLNTAPDVRVFWLTTTKEKERFGAASLAATQAVIDDGEQSADSHKWWRQDWQQVQLLRDGVTLDSQGLAPAINVAAKILPDMPVQDNNATWFKTLRDVTLPSTPVFGILAAKDPQNLVQRVNGGRLWQRMQLQAALDGIAMQPLGQLTERADREAQLGLPATAQNALSELLNSTSYSALLCFRLGYPTQTGLPSPRRSLDQVTRK